MSQNVFHICRASSVPKFIVLILGFSVVEWSFDMSFQCPVFYHADLRCFGYVSYHDIYKRGSKSLSVEVQASFSSY